jgi:hypothetical protein
MNHIKYDSERNYYIDNMSNLTYYKLYEPSR